MRRAYPYVALEPVGSLPTSDSPVVGNAPTLATRRIYGTGAMLGLVFFGNKRAYVPIDKPFAGNGAAFPAFPLAEPSTVAPNAIRPALFVALNLYSPSGHHNPLTNVIPAPAEMASAKLPLPQAGRRASGNFTIPYPITTPRYPTAAQFVLDRVSRFRS